MLSLAVLVSANRRDLYALHVPWIAMPSFRGSSVSELLDDLALHVMETLPKRKMSEMPDFAFDANIELTRVRVQIEAEKPRRSKVNPPKPGFDGRFSVVWRRWPQEKLCLATIPALSTEIYAFEGRASLTAATETFVGRWIETHGLNRLNRARCGVEDYLEILDIDAERPTILPSQPQRKPRVKRKPARPTEKREPSKPDKRNVIAPHTLREIGTNLYHQAIEGRAATVYGRDGVIDNLLEQLENPGAAIVLVGPTGVGKSAIVRGLVQRLAAKKLPLEHRSELWTVDGNRIIAGMSVVGQWQRRCASMVHELSERRDILHVDDLPALVFTGRSAQSDTHVAGYLEPHLARGELRIIGECTPERWAIARDEAPGFVAQFQVLRIEPMSERETLSVLVAAARDLEGREPVRVDAEVLPEILRLSRRFSGQRCNPGRSAALLTRLASDLHNVHLDDAGLRQLDRKQLIEFFARETGLPRYVLWHEDALKYTEIARHFHRRIIGQNAASEALAETVTLLQQGLDDPDKPLATMIFVGPTGVGKTESAKALAEYLFGSADRMLRFDMSEFRDAWSAARLFGDRQRPDGELTRSIRETPFAVILLDEIEKADGAVFDAFLQVLGEGRLTNAAGVTTDFCNTVIIMTSNLGVAEADAPLGFAEAGGSAHDHHYHRAAEAYFRPEFFNRIDRIVAFRRLERSCLAPLVERVLHGILGRRGLARSGVVVDLEPELIDLLVETGFDPAYGARSLQRSLEQRLTIPLAEQLAGQPISRLNRASLYRRGRELGLDIESLTPPTKVEFQEDERSAVELERQFLRLARAHERLRTSAQLSEIEAEHAQLLAQFNGGHEEPAEMTRRETIAEALTGFRDFAGDLESLSEAFRERYAYDEFVELVGPNSGDYDLVNRPKAVGTERPYALHRGRQLVQGRRDCAQLESTWGEISHRLASLSGDQEYHLVRLLPASSDIDARRWAAVWCATLIQIWHSFAATNCYALDATRGWHEQRPDPAAETPASLGFALELRGYGLQSSVERECGYIMQTRQMGAELRCDLVRVENLTPKATDAVQCLQEEDERYANYRAARAAGHATESPRPQLELRRIWRHDEFGSTGRPFPSVHRMYKSVLAEHCRHWATTSLSEVDA